MAKGQKIGLFFGSFNPVHIGHLILANHFVEYSDLTSVWFVVSPQNPFKEKKTLLDQYQRLEMVRLAIDPYPKIAVTDVEFRLPQPSYTVHTLLHLREKYPQHDFSLIMGSDNLIHFTKWKNYQEILKHHPLYVYPRHTEEDLEVSDEVLSNTTIVEAPKVEISASAIRAGIKENKNVRPLLPLEVFEYLEKSEFYRNG